MRDGDDLTTLRARVAELERHREPVADTYACQRCGRRDGLDAVVPNDVWRTITEGEWQNPDPETRRGEVVNGRWNLLCLWCIDELCGQHGIETSASLHFFGNHITGGSQSDADADHVRRLCDQIATLERDLAALRAKHEDTPTKGGEDA